MLFLVRLVAYAGILSAVIFTGSAFSQSDNSIAGELDEEIATVGIQLFDQLCIKQSREESFFYAAMGKTATRKLTRDEYEKYLPSEGIENDFYAVPILDGKAQLLVGRLTYKDGGHNCIVVLKINNKSAERHWLNLFRLKYSQGNKLERDKTAPFYFSNRGRKNQVLVQIANVGDGFMSYYSFFK